MIPVGTLCMVVGFPVDNGKTCTTVCPRIYWRCIDGGMSYGYSVRMADGSLDGYVERCLRPIAPPGDPDAVPHSEPELVEIFR